MERGQAAVTESGQFEILLLLLEVRRVLFSVYGLSM